LSTNFDFSWLALNNTDFLSLLSENTRSLDSLTKEFSKNITYSFYTTSAQPLASDYHYIPAGQSANFKSFDTTQKNVFQGIVGYLSNLVDLSFQEVSAGTGQVRLANHNMTAGGYASYPYYKYQTLFLNNSALTDSSGYYIGALWHEFGHTLGLKHPFDSSGSYVTLNNQIDTRLLSIMSYSSISTVSEQSMDFAPLDMYELLRVYGPAKQSSGINFSFIGGAADSNQVFNNNNYSIELKAGNIFWVYGTSGVDSVDVSKCYKNTSTGVTVDCSAGYIDWDSTPSLSVDSSYALTSSSGWSSDITLPINGNLYFYPSDNINSFQVEKIILTDKVDTIINGTEFKEINAMGGNDIFSGFADGLSIDGGSGADKLTLSSSSNTFLFTKPSATTFIAASLDNNQHLTLSNIETISFSDTTVSLLNQTITGTNKDDNILSGFGDDPIYGLGGNDTINGSLGNDFIDGGTGYNTSVYSGSSINTTLSVSNLNLIAQDRGGTDGTDTLTSIQNLQFTDQSLQSSWFTDARNLATSNPSQFKIMTEMYLAYFNRAPDAVGLNFWAADSYNGSSNIEISNTFASTPEFIKTFGDISSQSSSLTLSNFVTAVYENVLNRTAEQSGFNFWLNGLQTNQVTPGNLILSVIEAVNGQTGTTDSIYFSNKTAVATHFAVFDGLTNTTQATAVMNLFNNTYQTSGITAAVAAANALADQYLTDVTTTPQLVVNLDLVGLVG
jgi:hypothetical protein